MQEYNTDIERLVDQRLDLNTIDALCKKYRKLMVADGMNIYSMRLAVVTDLLEGLMNSMFMNVKEESGYLTNGHLRAYRSEFHRELFDLIHAWQEQIVDDMVRELEKQE